MHNAKYLHKYAMSWKKIFHNKRYNIIADATIADATIAVEKFLKLNAEKKVMMVCGAKKDVAHFLVNALGDRLLLCLTGENASDEKAIVSNKVVNKSFSEMLVSTYLISEGIEASLIKMRILFDHFIDNVKYV